MDLIDREALINAVEDLYEYAELGEALDVIKAAPTVEVDKLILIVAKRSGKREMMLNALRPHGKWVNISGFASECSICKTCEIFPNFNFCPNCGADMREANDET